MPFADESMSVAVVSYRPRWRAGFEVLAAEIRGALGGQAVAVDHVGSTSVPGLAAKDCIDVRRPLLWGVRPSWGAEVPTPGSFRSGCG